MIDGNRGSNPGVRRGRGLCMLERGYLGNKKTQQSYEIQKQSYEIQISIVRPSGVCPRGFKRQCVERLGGGKLSKRHYRIRDCCLYHRSGFDEH